MNYLDLLEEEILAGVESQMRSKYSLDRHTASLLAADVLDIIAMTEGNLFNLTDYLPSPLP